MTHRHSAGFIMVPCKCGRILRAKQEQLGSEIVCWDCRAAQVVAIPRARVRFLSVLIRAVLDLLDQEALARFLGVVGLFVLALSVPYAGIALAGVLLTLGAAAFGEMVAASGDPEADADLEWADRLRRVSPARWAGCIGFAAGTVLPLWVLGAGFHRSPHLNWASLAVLATTWVTLPVLLAALSPDEALAAEAPTRRLDFLRVHPIISLIVLAIPPLALVAAEVVALNVVYHHGTLPLVALDFMPIPGQPAFTDGVPFYNFVSYAELPAGRFNQGYSNGLRQGYSLVGSLPPSLSLSTRAGINPGPLRSSQGNYLVLRLALVGLMSVIVGLAFAIQARCLSVLTHARRLRAA